MQSGIGADSLNLPPYKFCHTKVGCTDRMHIEMSRTVNFNGGKKIRIKTIKEFS